MNRSWSLFLNHVLLLQNRPRAIKPGQNRPRPIKPGQLTEPGYFIEGSLRVKVSSFSLVLIKKCNNFFWLWCKQLMFYHYDYTKCCKNHDSMWLVIVKVFVSIGERISGYQHQIICTFLFSLICDQHAQSLITSLLLDSNRDQNVCRLSGFYPRSVFPVMMRPIQF